MDRGDCNSYKLALSEALNDEEIFGEEIHESRTGGKALWEAD